MDKQEDGRYAVLNREYKPLGFMTTDLIKYSDYPVCAKIKGIGPAVAQKLSFDGSPDTDRIYLYNDASNPTRDDAHMKNYLKKLASLAKLKID